MTLLETNMDNDPVTPEIGGGGSIYEANEGDSCHPVCS